MHGLRRAAPRKPRPTMGAAYQKLVSTATVSPSLCLSCKGINKPTIEAVLTSRPVLGSNSRNVFCFRTEKALALGRLVTGQLNVFLVFVLANCLGQTLQEWLKSSLAHSINSVIWIARRGHCAIRVIESSHTHTKIRICIAECKSAPPWLVLKIPRQRLVASGTSADTGPEPWLMHPGHPSWTHKPGIART